MAVGSPPLALKISVLGKLGTSHEPGACGERSRTRLRPLYPSFIVDNLRNIPCNCCLESEYGESRLLSSRLVQKFLSEKKRIETGRFQMYAGDL